MTRPSSAKVDVDLDEELAWDDAREQRLLGASLDRFRAGQRARASRRVTTLRAMTVCLVAACGVAGAVVASRARSVAPLPPAPLASVAVPASTPSTPNAEGLHLVQRDGAEVALLDDDADGLLLEHRRGMATYEVTDRRVAVRVGDARIAGRGVRFAIDVADDAFGVTVEQGALRIEAGNRTFDLERGDSLRLPMRAAESRADAGGEIAKRGSPAARARGRGDAAVDELFDRASDARRRGDLTQAAELLRSALDRRPDATRAAVALFALGRVERARGRAGAAADAFLRCESLAPTDALADDALAEAAESLASSDPSRARELALRYLRRQPRGEHRARMTMLAQ